MDSFHLLRALQLSRVSISRLSVPSKSGVYALFLVGQTTLHGFSIPSDQPVYIGSSSNLAERELGTHFNSKGTGFSTVRRSLGALLKNDLQLIAQPRGQGKTKQDFYCYRFNSDGEDRLTKWINQHIHVGAKPIGDYKAIEKELIKIACPLLNLKGWSNQYTSEIQRLRKACADEARTRVGRSS